MELTNIKDLFREKEKYQGRKVTVGGWVRSNRGFQELWIPCSQ